MADSFDAMTSDRPYRNARGLEAARAEIERCRGTQFDPRPVDAFLRIPADRLRRIHEHAPHAHALEVAAS